MNKHIDDTLDLGSEALTWIQPGSMSQLGAETASLDVAVKGRAYLGDSGWETDISIFPQRYDMPGCVLRPRVKRAPQGRGATKHQGLRAMACRAACLDHG
jgi:hypothetical protein